MTETLVPVTTRANSVESRLAASARLPSIDRMRGLVIVLMALDHVRDFFNADAFAFDPTDLDRTYAALFLTRFITHYCAPTFVFLAGVSAFLHGEKLGNCRALAWFLLTRGIFLVLLDSLVISMAWTLQPGPIILATLWALGIGMIALSGLVFLGPRLVLCIGAIFLFGHNLLDVFHAADFGALAPFWMMLHEKGRLVSAWPIFVSYPVLPWIGIMALGYGLGGLFLEPVERRDRRLVMIGLAAIAAFVVLRGTNFYGDPRPWTIRSDSIMTILSSLNVTKYPPSLHFALITLGPVLILLPLMDRLRGFVADGLETFGRVPLFFYVLHLYVTHCAAVALWLAAGFSIDQLRAVALRAPPPDGLGLGLAATYGVWVLVVIALYPACRWYAGIKARRRDWWLSYL
jgi:uncharacterized membrane protein